MLPPAWSRGAHFVGKILNIPRPSDLPFEQGHQVRLGDQREDRGGLGLTIPQSVLGQVDR
jgi:hypothetical protein